MPIFTRTKRVTDPLDDRVKNRIVGREPPAYVSSGSEHSAVDDDSSSSPCLSDLLDCFLHHGGAAVDDDGEGCNATADDDGCPTNDNNVDSDPECDSDRTDAVIERLVSISRSQNVDPYRNVLLANVIRGVEMFQSQKPNKQMLNRNVMMFLQNIGYNAAVCKTKWESCGGLTSGNHEFIDVVRSDSSGVRYFIDVNFAAEFDIARATEHFRRVLRHIPTVFVGKSEDLKQIVKLLSDSTRRSLKTRGLLLPPWRKNRFMQNKWFAPYRRTANYTPASFSPPATSTPGTVKCRAIGFNAVNTPLLPAATRTR